MDKFFSFASTSKAEALLMRNFKLSNLVISKNIMSTFEDEDMLWAHPDAPPIFDLPPPPRPPWLEDLEDCDSGGGGAGEQQISKEQIFHRLETCDNPLISGHNKNFEETFHSAAVILVCSIVFVIILLSIAFYAFRRRKSLYHQHSDHCHPGSDSMAPSSTSDSEINQLHHQNIQFHQIQSDSAHSMKRNAMRRPPTSSSMGRFPNALLTMPNHYIPDTSNQLLSKDNSDRQSATMNNVSGQHRRNDLLSPEQEVNRSRNLMELTDRPPAHLYHNYPHIIIAGQPFYLIPSDPSRSEEFEIDSYAYPQCGVPIYEEIDNNGGKCHSECSASDQGEIGSLRRNEDISPRPLHRPITSHSQHTNSSDLSSSDNSSQLPKLGPRLLVNPMVRDTAFQDTSFSDSYESNNSNNSSGVSQSQPRFANGNSSKDSMQKPNHLVTRFPRKSPATNSTSSGSQSSSSIYYYSDTLRNKNSKNHKEEVEEEDPVLVDTQIVLLKDEKKIRNKNTTQV